MIKLIKNGGQITGYEGKYVLYTEDFKVGKLYAVPNLWNVFDYIKAKFKKCDPTITGIYVKDL